jgi:RNA polymerase sigma-70 factor (ECF subfamily)
MERIEHEELQQLLDLLSSDQREVVLLRFVGGFGISEIAEIVGKKAGAVQALQRRALARLKRILEEGVRNPGDVAVTRVHEAFEAIS